MAGGGVGAYRTSALKDWWDGSPTASTSCMRPPPPPTPFAFSNAGVAKTVSLANATTHVFAVSYAMPGKTLYVRNGLSPDLDALLRTGQRNLAEEATGTTALEVTAIRPAEGRASAVKLAMSAGAINTAATDKSNTWNTVDCATRPRPAGGTGRHQRAGLHPRAGHLRPGRE